MNTMFAVLLVLGLVTPAMGLIEPEGGTRKLYDKLIDNLKVRVDRDLFQTSKSNWGSSSKGEKYGKLVRLGDHLHEGYEAGGGLEASVSGKVTYVATYNNAITWLRDMVPEKWAAHDKVEIAAMLIIPDKAHDVIVRPVNPAAKDPNRRYFPSPLVKGAWNAQHGNGVLDNRYHFPIFYVTDPEDIELLENRTAPANDFFFLKGKQQSCKAEFAGSDLPMYSEGETAEECLKNRHCYPIGGQSVFASVEPLGRIKPSVPLEPLPQFIVMGAITSANMFDDKLPAANTVASHTVAMLTAFEALKRGLSKNIPNDVIFMFLTAEDMGYLGGRRMLHDISNCDVKKEGDRKICAELKKISKSSISYILNVDQVGAEVESFAVHHNGAPSGPTDNLIKALTSDPAVKIGQDSLPPTSIISFLEDPEIRANLNVGAAVLSGYDSQFPSTYTSARDTAENVEPRMVKKAASIITDTITKLIGASPVALSDSTFDQLYECLVKNMSSSSCVLGTPDFKEGQTDEPNFYPGIQRVPGFRYQMGTHAQQFIHRFLVNVTMRPDESMGTDCKNDTACQNSTDSRGKFNYCVAGKCVASSAYHTDGHSPAINWNSSIARWTVNEEMAKKYPEVAVTQSYIPAPPSPLGVRLFQDNPAGNGESIMLAMGIVVFISSCVAIPVGKKYLYQKFKLN